MKATRTGLTRYATSLPLMLCIALMVAVPDFRQMQNVVNFSGQIAALLMVSLGQMFVTLAGGIDLSVGSVVSLASCIVATQPDPASGVLLALLAGASVGLLNGVGVAIGNVHPFVTTLSTATILQGVCYPVLPVPGGQIAPALGWLASGNLYGVPLSLAWCAVSIGFAWHIVARSRLGLHLHAIGAGAHSAHLNGVRVRATTIAAHVLCGLMAAAAGIYLAARVSAGDPTIGAEFALESVAAVALGGVQLTGGVGGVAAVLVGVATLGLLTNGLNLFGISPFLASVAVGMLLLLAVGTQRRKTVGL
ncbi:ABC transporter permease [Burkholderia sp. GS2Y]|uniref:ABC transporter permease n=1 Tax=Burkholderia theae TaxID=3143496 RepID=A0ABU9WJ80_9BURK